MRNKRINIRKKDNFYIIKDSFKTNMLENITINISCIAIFIIKFLILINIYKNTKTSGIFYKYSKISLKIKGKGENQILGDSFRIINYIKDVFINGNKQNKKDKKYYFNQTKNFVEIILDDNLQDCAGMFSHCNKITEINLSEFNASQVTSVSGIFSYCSSLISINLSNFNTSFVSDMYEMFYDCSSLISLDLSNFDTSHVSDMNYMFYGCSSLTSLDLSNFDTSQVYDIYNMFSYCSSLISLNLSNFDTSKVTKMYNMFYSCSSLISLDLSNFNTSNADDMTEMFYNCSSLTSLDLSNFNTSNVERMNNMFYNCSSLTSLNLSNFFTLHAKKMESMFQYCINLEFINLNNFDEKNLEDYDHMFTGVPENVVICLNEKITKNKILPQIINKTCHTIYCSYNWKSKQKKIFNNANKCNESCDNNIQYKYEYNGKCLEYCPNGLLFDEYNNPLNECKCELDKCLLCPQVALNKDLCSKCNINYYQKENDPLNIGEYINCYNQPDGYYLDIDLYKKCYHTCKTCNVNGNNSTHNCLKCNKNFLFGIKINNYFNCYENCSYYYYLDNEFNFLCTINSSCPEEYPKLIENKMECVKYTIEDKINNLFLNNKKNLTVKSKEKEIEIYDEILQIIEEEFTSENYNTFKLKGGQDDIIKTDKIITTFTTSENQKNNINNNMTRIDFGECETLLRNFYNISINESLFIKKIDIYQEGMKTLKVEYDVYAKLFGTKLIKLNLTICENSKISILIPIIINDHLDKLHISSGYYNDTCYTTTSEDGTDIILKDRQKEFIDKDKIVCQEDCVFSEYDYDTFMAKCSCDVKECSKSFADMNINKDKILDNFINIKNIINFNFLKCYKKLFNKKGFMDNIGCYLMLSIIFFHIITIFVFSVNQFSSLKNKIKKILSVKTNEIEKTNKISRIKQFNNKKNSLHQNYKKKFVKSIKFNHKKTLNGSKTKLCTKNLSFNSKSKKNENIKKFIDEEMNGFSYQLALQYDKRNYCQYYISLIKTQHNLICALCNKNDYNCGIIKINLFFIGFTIEYTVNALFYNDDTMHKIYESKGDFDLETQLPIAIYSTIISIILNYPLNYLSLSNDAVLNFKQDDTNIKIMKKAKVLINTLLKKFVIYFIVSFLFLLFFWYYISMFGVIYKNIQFHLLKDTLMSTGLSLLIPFIIYILPGIFRIPSLSNRNKKRVCLYNFSKFLQSF